MNTLRMFGAMITILILRVLLRIRGEKKLTINWQDEEAIEIPIRRKEAIS